MRIALNLSPWPGVWSLGEGRGTPSEFYSLKAQEEAGFRPVRLFPSPPDLPYPADLVLWTLRFFKLSAGFHPPPDLLVAHSPLPALAAWRLARRWRIPAVLRLYGVYWPGRRPRWKRVRDLPEWIALKLPFDLVIMTEDGTCGERMMRRLGVRNYRFWPNGIEPALLPFRRLSRREARSRLGLDREKGILVACRLAPWKRVDRAIRVVSLLPEAALFIAGDGPERLSLEALTHKLGLEKRVHFLGVLSKERLWTWMRAVEAYLCLAEFSCMGSSTLEALALGVPAVLSDRGCLERFGRHAEIARWVDPETLPEVAAALQELLADSGKATEMGLRAQVWADEHLPSWPERLRWEREAYRTFYEP